MRASTRDILIAKLERFLTLRTRGDDLGLRLRGEQLAAGVRFLRLVREGAYDLVIGNPPYQGTSKMQDAKYVATHYPKAKADLYAVFLQRGLELAKPGGLSALLTMRNWMFISQYSAIREFLIDTYDLRALGDFDRGAFDEVPNEVLSVVASIFCRAKPTEVSSIATQPTLFDDSSYDRQRTNRKRAAVLAQVGRYEFQTQRFNVIQEKPIIYWWDEEFLKKYAETPKIEFATPVRAGMQTSNNIRFLRQPWELDMQLIDRRKITDDGGERFDFKWVPYIKGASGKDWFEPLDTVVLWENSALEKQLIYDHFGSKGGGNGTPSRHFYFRIGVAFSMIGATFRGRAHRFRSVIGDKGASVFPDDVSTVNCLLNSRLISDIITALNPSVKPRLG